MPQNVVGPQIRRLRDTRDWSQEVLAARCGRLGWDLSRGTLAKVESGFRCVTDGELVTLARALRVSLDELYPPGMRPRGR